ncbi:MAG: histidine--tRNA ligase [Eubacteriales bacterium]|nr:histidine--tRNA ligase [Eubacteriales bacterium]MDD3110454.1 histidine--tRNA ligase [Eubacteriales bacterium]MDD3571698.1 histidine--tRNA ligase [Eubacteriales bacterium]MDD4134927.1 histidine--tRNA ligase [Eubacteriales bacterium]
MAIQSPKGTKDMLPQDSSAWQWIEQTMRQEAALAGYLEIRTPVFEHTELFERGVGDTTDIVQKEMYTFLDKGGRSITLKPEGTAGTVRAFVQGKLYAGPLPVKLYYLNSPIFRYENPQSGRLREHHQFGMECFGSREPTADAELITTILHILGRLRLRDLGVNINSIGCPACRPGYHQALKAFLRARLDQLCPVCKERFEKNPLRVLDCKEARCVSATQEAPEMPDYLCQECEEHFATLKALLTAQSTPYQVNPRIVRGLDYYTKTVFEITMRTSRGDLALCGGGRYDGLVEEIGGPVTPGVGFGIGTERILMELASQGIGTPSPSTTDVFVAHLGDEALLPAFLLTQQLRRQGLKSDSDHIRRSLKAQLRFADKLGVILLVIVGGEELARGKVKIKDMCTGAETEVEGGQAVGYIQQKLSEKREEEKHG